jgi:hypothetical protein
MFYADVPLAPNEPNVLTITDTAAGAERTKTITWQPCEITAHSGGTFYVRAGAALLLQSNSSITITPPAGGATETIPAPQIAGSATPFVFGANGTYQLATADAANNTTATLTVVAVAANLQPAPSSILGQRRDWIPATLDAAVELLNDDGLILAEGVPVLSKRAFSLQTTSGAQNPQNIVARIGETGPVLDVVSANILQQYGNGKVAWDVIQKYTDGSELWRGQLNLAGVLNENIRVVITPYNSGVTFLDGSIRIELTAADFDANNSHTYYVLKASAGNGAPCHTIKIYDGDQLIWSTDL